MGTAHFFFNTSLWFLTLGSFTNAAISVFAIHSSKKIV